ncbi:MAG: hypothetical protein Q9173_006176, partial [Seirophora scorigena]
GHEDGQADDLEAEARDHDVDACLLRGLCVGSVGQGATDGLQDEGEDVAADENDGVGAGFEAGDGFAVDEDDAREGEVDGCGYEAGSYGEDDDVPVVFIIESRSAIPAWTPSFFFPSATRKRKGRGDGSSVQQERIAFERVIVHLHTGDVADDLQHKTAEHAPCERPCAKSEAKSELQEEQDGEKGEVEGIAAQRRDVIDLSEGEGTGFEGAEIGVVEEGDVEAGLDQFGQGIVGRHGGGSPSKAADRLRKSKRNLSVGEREEIFKERLSIIDEDVGIVWPWGRSRKYGTKERLGGKPRRERSQMYTAPTRSGRGRQRVLILASSYKGGVH